MADDSGSEYTPQQPEEMIYKGPNGQPLPGSTPEEMHQPITDPRALPAVKITPTTVSAHASQLPAVKAPK